LVGRERRSNEKKMKVGGAIRTVPYNIHNLIIIVVTLLTTDNSDPKNVKKMSEIKEMESSP